MTQMTFLDLTNGVCRLNSLRQNFVDSSKFSVVELNNLKSINEASKYNTHPNREGTPPIKN